MPIEDAARTIGHALAETVRRAGSYTTGDQVKPCAILWTDPQRLWAAALGDLKDLLPELFVLGSYEPAQRTGPAVWLRCLEARQVEPRLQEAAIPIFYLPGISRQRLREVEDCPVDLQPLVELQFRGTVWLHPSGRDWTPYTFLASDRGGLGLDVPRDGATTDALQAALSRLLSERLADLKGQHLDVGFFRGLLTPDTPSALLRWMNSPRDTRAQKDEGEWSAFVHECQDHYGLDPEKDGELAAAEKLGGRQEQWRTVWQRFAEAPQRYPGVVGLLERADPSARGHLVFDKEPWPRLNDAEEKSLAEALSRLRDRRHDEAAREVHGLERLHCIRRSWVWSDLGRCQLAVALEHLDRLATLAERPLAAASLQELGDQYARSGWETDEAALSALACTREIHHEQPLTTAVRSLYFRWLDESARNLQTLVRANPELLQPRLARLEAAPGRVILFADGLRFDVARLIEKRLRNAGLMVDLGWDWSPFPPVTATAKPQVSPIAGVLTGGEAGDDFAVTVAATGQRLTTERFQGLLRDAGIEVLGGMLFENVDRKCWLEAGTLDKRGHQEGWKLARALRQEVQDLVDRICGLLDARWKEVVVVTDHGWLLLPAGFPKAELSKHVVEHKWGRCAAMKELSATDLPVVPWFWNPAVQVVTPHGIGCFKAGMEYIHGGLSLQELVIPRMTVTAGSAAAVESKLASVKWVGLRCRVTVEGFVPGLRVDLRGRPADPQSSKLENNEAKEVPADGTVSVTVRDTADEGAAAVIVLLAPDGRLLDTRPTVIGANA